MTFSRPAAIVLALCAYLAFVAGTRNLGPSATTNVGGTEGAVVLPPELQIVLYLGDRYLAANVESTRVLATGGDIKGDLSDYFHRLHQVVSDLNSCHEDNYYIANALLAWAGGIDAALDILRGATTCRFWDEVPPFFLGYNLYFFKRKYGEAKDFLFSAAERSTANRVGFQKMGIMFESESYPDVAAARNYLMLQREAARDQKLQHMLTQRIDRLNGLITLRTAQVAYERKNGIPLEDPNDLLASGVLTAFPDDPIKLGYEFANGQFSLKELQVRGMERRPK
jgi:hypothetical protein